MPSEYRKIVFSAAELRMALANHCARQMPGVSQGVVEDLNLEWQGDQAAAVLRFRPVSQAGTQKVDMGGIEIAAALIAYCQDNDAKIPHFAEKALAEDPEGIALMIRFAWTDHWGTPKPE